jgi:ArsR family transcriptional regulator
MPPGRGGLKRAEAERLTRDLDALAHPIRLQLLDVLLRHEGRVCVCDLQAAVPVKQPTVSHHLRLLREAGLVTSERDGLWAYYRVRREALAALRARIAAGLGGLA